MAAGGWRTFARSRVGLVVLLIIGVLALSATLLYLGDFVAILALLIFGLALPIYLGQRGLRTLAFLGLGIILVTAPVFTVLYTDELRVPSPIAHSQGSLPYGNGGDVVQDAQVTPFDGAPGGLYNFSAMIFPQYLPVNTTITNVTFYVTDCPGATTNSTSGCGSGYPFYTDTIALDRSSGAPTPVSYARDLPGVDAWWWDLVVVAVNDSDPKNVTDIWLYNDGSYVGLEGPVSGSFGAVVELFLPTAYEIVLIYPGSVFLVALLVYAFLKRRELSRKAMMGAAGPSAGPGAPGPGPAAPPIAGASTELRCPNCQAVVYPNETTCWKCGKALAPPQPASSTPLPPSKPA